MKNGKKILLLLIAILILSTSVGHAQGFKYSVKTIVSEGNGNYVIKYGNISDKYLNSRLNNILSQLRLIWNIDDIEETQEPKEEPQRPDNPQPQPEEPKEEEPQRPNNPQKPEEPKEEPTTPIEPGNSSVSAIEREVVRLVNIERQKAGLAPLTLSAELSKVARIKSQDMADKNYFSHTSPTYGDPFEMMRSFGIKFGYAGENIAKGYRSAESVMKGWMNSSGHRANIFNPNFKTIGVGYAEANGTTYWTQMFTD